MKAKANKNNEQTSGNFSKKLILVSLFSGFLVAAMIQIDFDVFLPIKKIIAQGEFINVTEKMILDAITNDINGGYLKVDVHKLKLKIEKLAWIKIASVRRVWPDSVVVSIQEQKAYAYWKESGLLNEVGEKFKPEFIGELQLPELSGPDYLNVKIMSEFKLFESEINKINLKIIKFKLDDRRAIYFSLSNDIKISLGRKDHKTRLSRFITAYKLNLKKYSNSIEYIDMRYTNGFSVKWKKSTHAAKAENVLRGNLDV